MFMRWHVNEIIMLHIIKYISGMTLIGSFGSIFSQANLHALSRLTLTPDMNTADPDMNTADPDMSKSAVL